MNNIGKYGEINNIAGWKLVVQELENVLIARLMMDEQVQYFFFFHSLFLFYYIFTTSLLGPMYTYGDIYRPTHANIWRLSVHLDQIPGIKYSCIFYPGI